MNHLKQLCLNSILCLMVIDVVLPEELPQVTLKNGATIIGKANKTVDENKTYYSFRGIPYAKPPVGDLRFKPPVPLTNELAGKTIHAFEDGEPCTAVSLTPTGSEDCLYLNVYTTQFPSKNMSLQPVMVRFSGGGFISEDGGYATIGPDFFLDEESILMVTFNYRVGIIGFLSTEDLHSPGNYGLKDMLLVLRWVQENIKYFGGDPNKVTAFGESAGAASLSYLTQSSLTEGLLHRVIFESGTSINLWGLTRNPKDIAIKVATLCGVDTTNSQSLVKGLRSTDIDTLQRAETLVLLKELGLLQFLQGLPFGVTMEPPHAGAVVVNKSHEQLENGLFSQVPYLMGFNSFEIKFIINAISVQSLVQSLLSSTSLPLVGEPLVEIVDGLPAIYPLRTIFRLYLKGHPKKSIPASMNINQSDVLQAAYAIASYYHYYLDTYVDKFLNDDQINRPILEAGRLYSRHATVYLYRYSYKWSLGSEGPGVGHAEQLYAMWRWSKSYFQFNLTASDLLTRKRMIKLWTNFAITGNPTPENDSLLQNVEWPRTNEHNSLTYLDIGKDLLIANTSGWAELKFWRNLFNRYGNPPFATY